MVSNWPLVDRGAERQRIDDLLELVRQGLSGVLVLRGGDGVGKTSLVDYAVRAASGFRISAIAGVESEINLPHGALHQLLIPFLPLIDDLPVPQRQALQAAFGLIAGPPPERFLVGLACLTLLYGQWLRRAKRRRDARRHLRIAAARFRIMGAISLADEASSELRATGERARARTPRTELDLTPQEARVAKLAADGATNNEIAEQLFISPSTVDYHLGKVFRKLGIRSRAELAHRLPSL
jgi:DNA-binding CsgD family transcriptional regulator